MDGLHGKKVMVTAGPTREHIDPVRFLTNASTGKMGFAIAASLRNRGSEVVLVTGPVSIPEPDGVEIIKIVSAEEMYQVCSSRFLQMDMFIGTAAVADYTPKNPAALKIKKKPENFNLEFVRTKDIIRELAQIKGSRIVVGFAAETHDHHRFALEKLRYKNLDLIVVNDVFGKATGFAADTNQVTIIDKSEGVTEFPLLSKEETAEKIVSYLEEYIICRWDTPANILGR
ncbi:MAG: bifunctional phosphopantothenoylcysteine decarboxylase/phosphopantothenate--cysteine ligase CoaBC [Planctomycetes bacterium]|nr:bifunctional phosphopantothenoylcysteine decarboxylase/phosphopantothenate--cysteine ligase CoaBC [Planctomycetota bacterium]